MNTYDRRVVDEVVETLVADDRRDLIVRALDPVSVVDVELDDLQRSLSRLLQPMQRRRPRRVSRGRNDEVLRRLEEGLRELQSDAARAAAREDKSLSGSEHG